MQIQRIQSVYLLIAAVLMALMSFLIPIATLTSPDGLITSVYLSDFLPVLILDLLTAVLLLIAIFLFKNLNLQIKVTKICIVLILVTAAILFTVLYSQVSDIEIKWIGSTIFLVCSFASSVLALSAINRDKKTLDSYNRLR